jgi:hypothetical protein
MLLTIAHDVHVGTRRPDVIYAGSKRVWPAAVTHRGDGVTRLADGTVTDKQTKYGTLDENAVWPTTGQPGGTEVYATTLYNPDAQWTAPADLAAWVATKCAAGLPTPFVSGDDRVYIDGVSGGGMGATVNWVPKVPTILLMSTTGLTGGLGAFAGMFAAAKAAGTAVTLGLWCGMGNNVQIDPAGIHVCQAHQWVALDLRNTNVREPRPTVTVPGPPAVYDWDDYSGPGMARIHIHDFVPDAVTLTPDWMVVP